MGKRLTAGGSPEPPNDGFLYHLIAKLAPNLTKVRAFVDEAKKENPQLTPNELADYLSDRIVWTFTMQGAVLSLPGAIPGFGTIVQIAIETGAVSADFALMIRNQAYLVFTLACCYGLTGREILIQDTLICIGLWTKALVLTKSRAIRMGSKILETQFRKKFPAKVLQAINRKLGTTVLTKYGTKRGGIALGKTIPFGVGVAVGGGFNYLVMKRFKLASTKYFSLKKNGDQ